jgi:formylglycine-generating enzyme required for sulfatase activity
MPHSPARRFSGIFISYRRDDSGGHAGRLLDRLSAHFGEDQIFMDIDYIEPGEDFVQVIEEAVGSCEILIALIGRGWPASRDETGRRRLDNPKDFVRLEIAAALDRHIRVIPVLVQGAPIPRPQDLPEDLLPLSRRHAFELSDLRWKHDVDRLIRSLEKILARQREAHRRAEQEEAERCDAEALQTAEVSEQLKQAAAETFSETFEETAPPRAVERAREQVEATPPAANLETKAAHTTSPSQPGTRPKRARLTVLTVVAVAALIVAVSAIALRQNWQPGKQLPPAETPSPPAGQVKKVTTGQVVAPSQLKVSETQAPPGMVYVPGGEFQMGNDAGDEYEKPAHAVTVNPFFIDQYEVTNEEYADFIIKTGHKPTPQTWTKGAYRDGEARRPVTGVTWHDADAYAKSVGKRLPTEAEWEFAARGTDGRRYPWGDKWRPGQANAGGMMRGMADVGAFKGASPFGAFDMVGNAWEWTSSELKAYPGGRLPEQPASDAKVLRGGSYQSNKSQATATYRLGWRASGEASYAETGFRCVKDITNAPTVP